MTSREIQTRNAYDTLAKEFIRDTRVLAYMFKDCVPAFSSSSIEEIKSEIDACHGMIDHAGGEIPLASGARIIPDLLFAAKQLKGNVDFQKDKPSYKLEARIAAYASALLCHQIDPPIERTGSFLSFRSGSPITMNWKRAACGQARTMKQ